MSETEVDVRDLMDRMQRRRYQVLCEQYTALDREHYELCAIEAGFGEDPNPEVPVEDRLAAVRRGFRQWRHAHGTLMQEVDPQPVEVLEEWRIEAWVHQCDRATYRISARPWQDSDPWWEPGYLDWDGRL